MKFGVIDVGSNSVRLMISVDGITQEKHIQTTRLAENMGTEKMLQAEPIERTVGAVSFFVEMAKREMVDKIYIFATAAVRQSKNKDVFLLKVKEKTGVDVDVISGDSEAFIGAIGALDGNDGGIIDVGGASSEVLVVSGGKIIYSKSINLGAVKIFNDCGQEKQKCLKMIDEFIDDYGEIPRADFYGIGGTATSVASIEMKMQTYNPKLVQGYVVTLKQVEGLRDMLFDLSLEEKLNLAGLQKGRAEIIAGGIALFYAIMKKIGLSSITISEKDNLEGYLSIKRGINEQKN